jgi:hypothetical protein
MEFIELPVAKVYITIGEFVLPESVHLVLVPLACVFVVIVPLVLSYTGLHVVFVHPCVIATDGKCRASPARLLVSAPFSFVLIATRKHLTAIPVLLPLAVDCAFVMTTIRLSSTLRVPSTDIIGSILSRRFLEQLLELAELNV